uniref:Si:ch73-132f6.5 n=1 Tax=Callorhinchus milii TaxID=7868 RepID=A0A4W3IFW9_CALMI
MHFTVSMWSSLRRPPRCERCWIEFNGYSYFVQFDRCGFPQLVFDGNLDFLVFDYLSEITMSLLTAAKAKSPDHGYAPDFVQVAMAPFIKDIHKRGIRVVSNAGGVNPHACAAALQEVVKKADVDLKIAVVTGDDLMPQRDLLKEADTRDMESGQPFPASLHSMNAYLGAGPISRALDLGADIVVTGRCVDSGVVLGPLIHTFGWKQNEFDLLAAGSLAGHLIECGAQCTGGIFTDWHRVPDWDNIGFPVVQCSSDGSFILTKPPKTGGLVSFGTVAEQLVYEIGDPQRYQLPDVVCDFSQVTISEIPDMEDRAVRVQGAKGSPPSDHYKVCATYFDGYRATAVCSVGGPRSVEKGKRTAESILKRTRRMFKQFGLGDFKSVNVEVLGSGETYGGERAVKRGPHEAVIWLAVQHMQKKALELFSREIAPAGTGMGKWIRLFSSPILKPFFFLYPKKDITVCEAFSDLPIGSNWYRLEELAYARSGDKGNSANIGIIARHPLYYPYLKKILTAKTVEEYFQHLIEKENPDFQMVTRFELPGIHGLNFVLKNSLGGGGVASLRSDPQLAGQYFQWKALRF